MLSLGLTALGGFVGFGEGTPAVYYHAGDVELVCPAELSEIHLVDNTMTGFTPSAHPAEDFNTRNLGCYYRCKFYRRDHAGWKQYFSIGSFIKNCYLLTFLPSSLGNATFAQYNNVTNAGQAGMRNDVENRWVSVQKKSGSDDISMFTDIYKSTVTALQYQATQTSAFWNFSLWAMREVDSFFAIAWTRAASPSFARHIIPLSDETGHTFALLCPESHTVKEL